ncbi:hypothetical protein Tco_1242271 [Tanacetum coccineum]
MVCVWFWDVGCIWLVSGLGNFGVGNSVVGTWLGIGGVWIGVFWGTLWVLLVEWRGTCPPVGVLALWEEQHHCSVVVCLMDDPCHLRKGMEKKPELPGGRLVVPMFQQGEYLIECINKAMAFLSSVASRFPPSNNQLRTSSNPKNQATIQYGRVTEKGHMARQYTQPKRPRNVAWFKEKLMLAKAQEASLILDEEQLAFLADLGISKVLVAQQTIPQNSAFQTEDLDAYDSDCDDISSTKAVLMANLSSCDPEVLSKDTNSSTPNDLLVLSLVEQMTDYVAHLDKENQINKMVNESLTAELERYKERVTIFEQRLNVDLNKHEKLIDSQMDDLIHDRNAKLAAFQQEIDTLKETLSNNVKEKEYLSKTLTVFKTDSKKESKYIDKEIVLEEQNKVLENIICKMYRSTQVMHMLTKPQVFYDDTHKQALGYQNPFHLKKAQRMQPTLYDGSIIAKEHAVIFVIDDEETLILEEESRSKMLDKQNDLISIEKKIKISPNDYSKLNKIKEDFAPSELPKILTSDGITVGSWGFEHTKECFVTEIVPFLKVLKDTINEFDETLLDEITNVQTVFNQMEAAVDQYSVDKNAFEIQIKQLSIDNDQLLKQIMSQEIVHIAVNYVDSFVVKKSCVNECNKCLELEIGLLKKKDLIEKDVYDKLLKSYSTLEKHCISLELTTQLNKEVFQKENFHENQNAPTFNQLFKLNELKAQLQEKDTVIKKLKDRIKSLSGKDRLENVKKDIDEIEIINIELEHSVAKLLSESENLRKEREHLKSIYKDQFNSIRKTLVQSKEHYNSLIAQINAKSVENLDLNAQL